MVKALQDNVNAVFSGIMHLRDGNVSPKESCFTERLSMVRALAAGERNDAPGGRRSIDIARAPDPSRGVHRDRPAPCDLTGLISSFHRRASWS